MSQRFTSRTLILFWSFTLAAFAGSLFLPSQGQDALVVEGVPAIASGGFGRPSSLGRIEATGDAQVGVADGAEGLYAVWEEPGGLRLAAMHDATVRGDILADLQTQGVRGLWAGAAGDSALVAWLERDLSDGRYRLHWWWRGETRNVLDTASPPTVRLVQGSGSPALIVALPKPDGWRLELHGWDGSMKVSAPRPAELTVVGLDAIQEGEVVRVAWMEGTNAVVLGRVQASWTTYVASWHPDHSELREVEAIGDGQWRGVGDVARLAIEGEQLLLAWPHPSQGLQVWRDGTVVGQLGRGRLLGYGNGTWLWIDDNRLPQGLPGVPAQTVLRLPAIPERVALGSTADLTGVAWSSGRYLGGLDVWSVTNAEPYVATTLDRLALAMGWDPWRIGSALAGHTLTALLVAMLLSLGALPIWWIAAALLGRRDGGSVQRVRIDGLLVGTASVVWLATILRLSSLLGVQFAAALAGDVVWTVAGVILGAIIGTVALAGRDLEATSGRLLAASLSGTVGFAFWSFGTLNAWQIIVGAPG